MASSTSWYLPAKSTKLITLDFFVSCPTSFLLIWSNWIVTTVWALLLVAFICVAATVLFDVPVTSGQENDDQNSAAHINLKIGCFEKFKKPQSSSVFLYVHPLKGSIKNQSAFSIQIWKRNYYWIHRGCYFNYWFGENKRFEQWLIP